MKWFLIICILLHGTIFAASNDAKKEIAGLYIATFNRAPDATGLNYWANELERGKSLEQIAETFFKVPETQATYPASMSTTDFVNKVYQNLFSRDADSSGLDYWVSSIDNSVITREKFILTILNAAKSSSDIGDRTMLENKIHLAEYFSIDLGLEDTTLGTEIMTDIGIDKGGVELAKDKLIRAKGFSVKRELIELYIATFNRAPDASGLQYWANEIAKGKSLEEVAKIFFDVPDTQLIYPSSMTTEEFIDKVYLNVLNKVADADGKAYWLDAISSGSVSKEAFILAIIKAAKSYVGSDEEKLLNNKRILGEFYSVYFSLNDLDLSEDIMKRVTSDPRSIDTILEELHTVHEKEFNNNLIDANKIEVPFPITINGKIASDLDSDYFQLKLQEGDKFTAVAFSTLGNFQVNISLLDEFGSQVSFYNPSIYFDFFNITNAKSFNITKTGTYYLVIDSQSSFGRDNYQYLVSLFLDSDYDGVDDIVERKNNLVPGRGDLDGDGILDNLEVMPGLTDADGDGIKNWLDFDSDGDGILDLLEGISDNDKDNIPAFLDTDSDNNSIPDSVEAVDIKKPIDTDGDGIFDFADIDDDNDLILDVNDPERLVSATTFSSNADGLKFYTLYSSQSLYPNLKLPNVLMGGEKVVFEGINFAADTLVVIYDGMKTYNIKPNFDSATQISITAPYSLGSGKITLFSASQLRTPMTYSSLSNVDPILVPLNSAVKAGSLITLSGMNFSATGKLVLNGVATAFTFVNTKEIQLRVANDIESAEVWFINQNGQSNTFTMQVSRILDVTVDTSVAFDLSTLKATSVSAVVSVPSSGVFSLQRPQGDIQSVSLTLPTTTTHPVGGIFYSAKVLKSDSSVTLSAKSTAVDIICDALVIDKKITSDYYDEALTFLDGDTKVTEFANVIASELASDPYVLTTLSSNFTTAYSNAIDSAKILIDEKIASGELKKLVSTRSRLTRAISSNQIDGFYANLLGDPINGKLEIVNDTSVFASWEVTDVASGKVLAGNEHGSWFGRNILGPQGGWSTLYWATTTVPPLDLKFRNSQIEIRTAGFAGDETRTGVNTRMLIRTGIEKAIMPIVWQVIDIGVGDSKKKKVVEYLFQFGTAGVDRLMDDSLGVTDKVVYFGTDVISAFAKEGFSNVAYKIGNIIFDGAASDFIAEKVKTMAVKLGLKFALPQKAAVEIGGLILDIGNATYDIAATDRAIYVNVNFPLFIESISPQSIQRKDAADMWITLTGYGMDEWSTNNLIFANTSYKPTVIINNGVESIEIYDSGEIQTFADGKRLMFKISKSFIENATSDISVSVRHHSMDTQWLDEAFEITVAAPSISIVDALHIDSIAPNPAKAGESIVIQGSGFGDNVNDIEVYLGSAQLRSLPRRLRQADVSSISVQLPDDAKSGNLYLTVDGKNSNSAYLEIEEPDSSKISISIGDNGSLNDDTFALYIDSKLVYAMPAPHRPKVVVSRDLAKGQHTVQMKGITAPDDIGTYQIIFGSNVSVLSGDSMSGNDMSPNVWKTWKIDVSGGVSTKAIPTSYKILWQE